MFASQVRRLLALAFVAVTLAACAHSPPQQAAAGAKRVPTILISIDGFRPDYLDRGVTPALSKLAAEGARGAMRPSFPSKTFPNHYTLVTGLRPDHHGIVDNTMEDPLIPGVVFKLSDKAVAADPRWWNDATPIWVTAEKAGVKTGTMFWPGSDGVIQNTRPSYWVTYDMALSADKRVDQLLAWMDKPAAERPGFFTLYFDEVDTQGHNFGPDSKELNAAVAKTDAAIGRLVAGLAARGVAADIVVTADHGMAPVAPDRVIYLDDLVAEGVGRTIALGAFMTYVPAPGREAEAEAALLKPHAHLQCWRKGEIPARFHYGQHRRAPPIFCLPETGWEITTKAWVAKRGGPKGGNHGFDPFAPEMRAVFIAAGPDIKAGVTVPEFDNVDVYPLLARLIGIQPLANDGDLDELGSILTP